jgi:hypothetical protein
MLPVVQLVYIDSLNDFRCTVAFAVWFWVALAIVLVTSAAGNCLEDRDKAQPIDKSL